MKISNILVKCDRKDGKNQIYIQISHKGRKKIATGFFIYPSEWDAKAQKVNKKCIDFQRINNYLADQRAKYEKNERDLILAGDYYDITDIVADKSPNGDFVQYCKDEVARRKDLGKIQYSQENCYLNVIDLLEKFGGHVIPFKKITLKFIKDLHDFVIRDKADCSPTTQNKYQKHLRTLIMCAIDDRLIEPINWRRVDLVKKNESHIESLTSDQLRRLEDKVFTNADLDYVRELFLFCCYTGVPPIDLMKLTANNIVPDDKGIWLRYNRKKNGNMAKAPLHSGFGPKAMAIINKYQDPQRKTLFPSLSNQKCNAKLKIIQEIMGFSTIKKLCMYNARHTYITLMLENGIDIYNVKTCVGHSQIKTTQNYVHDASIDMNRNLREAKFDE